MQWLRKYGESAVLLLVLFSVWLISGFTCVISFVEVFFSLLVKFSEDMDENNIICEECGVKFTLKKNLYVHSRKTHNKDPVPPKAIKEICEICGQQFVNKSNLSRHLRQTHQVNLSKNIEYARTSRIKCSSEDDCNEYFRSYTDLRKHLAHVHKVEIVCDELQFESVAGDFCFVLCHN